MAGADNSSHVYDSVITRERLRRGAQFTEDSGNDSSKDNREAEELIAETDSTSHTDIRVRYSLCGHIGKIFTGHHRCICSLISLKKAGNVEFEKM